MKNKRFVFLVGTLVIIIVGLSGCAKLDKMPYNALTPEGISNSEGGLEAVTRGNYARIKNMSLGWHRVMEFPGDNVSLSGTTTSHLFYLYNYKRIPNNSFTTSFWVNSYQIIVSTSKIIESVSEGISPASDQLIGENYYLRAYLHFSLVNVFGKPYSFGRDNLGVPIKLDGDPDNIPNRSKVGEVYDAVLKDLDKAENLMTIFKSDINASREAAWALKSRVYLYMEENDSAIEYADKVINSGRFQLLPKNQYATYPTIKPESNPETIFAVKFVPDLDLASGGWSNIGSMYATIDGVGYGEMYASKTYLDLIMKYPMDVRNNFIVPDLNTTSNKIWAIYVDESLNYKEKVVEKSGSDYRDVATGTFLDKELNINGDYDYFVTDGGKQKKVIITPELNLRNGYPRFFITKCTGQEGQAQLWSPVVSRLAEMYLNRAEANAKIGSQKNQEDAIADVNLLRSRAGIPGYGLYDAANLPAGKTTLDIVLEERRLELAWEGHRKFDVYRNKLTMDRRYPGTHLVGKDPISEITPSDPFIIELIPQSQILAQQGLEQNP